MRDDTTIPRLSSGVGDGVSTMCVMQAVSWQTGDAVITDTPGCSSRYLSKLVQYLNDELADEQSGFLLADDTAEVLDFAWSTVGTAGAGEDVAHRWFAELLDNPRWGVIRFLKGQDREICTAVAQGHRMAAEGHDVHWDERSAAQTPPGKRTALQHLSMYVVAHAAGSSRSLESAVGMACHCNFYYASTKAERIRWVRTAIEAWISRQEHTILDEPHCA